MYIRIQIAVISVAPKQEKTLFSCEGQKTSLTINSCYCNIYKDLETKTTDSLVIEGLLAMKLFLVSEPPTHFVKWTLFGLPQVARLKISVCFSWNVHFSDAFPTTAQT